MIQFKSMTEEEFTGFRTRSLNEYTEDISENYDITFEEASEQASKQFDELLADGLNTEDHYFFNVVDGNTIVGIIWYYHKKEEKKVFIYEIWMDPEHRGKGYGSQTLELLNQYAKELGAVKIGLHVFGKNKGAIKLYNRMGYETTSMVMEHQL